MIIEGEVALLLIFLCNTSANSFIHDFNLLLEFSLAFLRLGYNAKFELKSYIGLHVLLYYIPPNLQDTIQLFSGTQLKIL